MILEGSSLPHAPLADRLRRTQHRKESDEQRADTSASARFESLTECPPRMGPSALPSMRVALCRGSMPAPPWMSPAPKPCRKHSAVPRQSHPRARRGPSVRPLRVGNCGCVVKITSARHGLSVLGDGPRHGDDVALLEAMLPDALSAVDHLRQVHLHRRHIGRGRPRPPPTQTPPIPKHCVCEPLTCGPSIRRIDRGPGAFTTNRTHRLFHALMAR